MENKTNPWVIILTIVITAIIVGGGIYIFQGETPINATPTEETKKEEEASTENAQTEKTSKNTEEESIKTIEVSDDTNEIIREKESPANTTASYTQYSNTQFGLAFDTPNGWSITNEETVNQGASFNQLRIVLSNDQNPNISISIYTPPLETGYPGYESENGFQKTIHGLTSSTAKLLRNSETGRLIAWNTYYKTEADWTSHIEFQYSAPGGMLFDQYLVDYYKLLDSVAY